MPSDLIGYILTQHPGWLDVAVYVYCAGWFISHAIRMRWPNEGDRSDAVKTVLVVADLCQTDLNAPVKAIGRRLQEP